MLNFSEIEKIVADYCKQKDIYVTSFKLTSSNKLSVFIDSFKGLTISDCSELSRYIESKVDREIEDYELEVSSAGLTEPFTVKEQYIKNKGEKIETTLNTGAKIVGILTDVKEDEIVVETEKKINVEGKKKKQLLKEISILKYKEIKTSKLNLEF